MFGLVVFRETEREVPSNWVCASSVHFEARGLHTYRPLRRWPCIGVAPRLARFRRDEKRRQRARAR